MSASLIEAAAQQRAGRPQRRDATRRSRGRRDDIEGCARRQPGPIDRLAAGFPRRGRRRPQAGRARRGRGPGDAHAHSHARVPPRPRAIVSEIACSWQSPAMSLPAQSGRASARCSCVCLCFIWACGSTQGAGRALELLHAPRDGAAVARPPAEHLVWRATARGERGERGESFTAALPVQAYQSRARPGLISRRSLGSASKAY